MTLQMDGRGLSHNIPAFSLKSAGIMKVVQPHAQTIGKENEDSPASSIDHLKVD